MKTNKNPFFLVVLLAGCGFEVLEPGVYVGNPDMDAEGSIDSGIDALNTIDLANLPDLATADLVVATDLADGGDMSQVVVMPDMAKAVDMAMQPPDIRIVPDMAILPDLAVVSDMSKNVDMAMIPTDMRVVNDLAVVTDMAKVADMAMNQDMATCNDGVANQDETDIDCGGQFCGPCALGKLCGVNFDCQKPYACYQGMCVQGKYSFNECPNENLMPLVMSCVAKCAMKYGDTALDWACGTDGGGPNGKAWGFWQSNVKALPAAECAGGNTPENDNFTFGVSYQCGAKDCAFSACVNAGCGAASNWCYRK